MISFDKAHNSVLNSARLLTTEKVLLNTALGRVLAEDVVSDMDMPPFNKSAMDGYACRRADLGNDLTEIEIIKAGDVPARRVEQNQCSRIMTGAKVPEGADCVIMVEQTNVLENGLVRFTATKTADNIAKQAEDMQKGGIALPKGTILRPQHIAILASVGCVQPKVYKLPQVSVLTTGDEILEPNEVPSETKIRNSNGSQLIAQLRELNIKANYFGIVEDTPEGTRKAINEALQSSDIVLLTGGVSMGDFDFVPEALKENGVEILFKEIAVKPGKPTVFGKTDSAFVFGLPGNPVSTFVIFELMVKPFIYKSMEADFKPLSVRLPLGVDYYRKKAERTAWLPVFINDEGEIMPVEYHGSAHLHSMCYSNGLVKVSQGVNEIKKGDLVNVRLLQ